MAKQTVIDIKNACIVFKIDFTAMGVYDSSNPTTIPESDRYNLVLPDPRGGVIPQFISIIVDGGKLKVTIGSDPKTKYANYPKIDDVWNTATELIVGTGDLRPSSKTFTVTPHAINTTKGIIVSSPGNGELNIYQLT